MFAHIGLNRLTHWRPCLWLMVLALAACGDTGESSVDQRPLGAKDIDINNRGVALMGYFDYAGAREAFREAVDRQPDWADVKINLAIATLNRQMDGDEVLARGYLDEVLAQSPDNLRAHFVSGLLSERAGDADRAKQHYQTVLDGDPGDAYAAYYLAVLTQTEAPQKALALFERAIELDPYLRSAYYGAFLLNVRSGNREAGLKMQAVYERLADNPRARLAETKYTRMGPKANALAIGLREPVDADMPEGALFGAPQTIATFDVPQSRSLTTSDLAGNGLQDIIINNPDGQTLVVSAGEDEYQKETQTLDEVGAVTAVAWADIDNDGGVDLATCGARGANVRLAAASGAWDAPRALPNTGRPCADLQLVDADHDGDLDVLIAYQAGAHDVINNNGDGSFRSLRAERDLFFGDAPGRQLLATDLDGDRDTDLLAVQEGGVAVLFNDRLWDYSVAADVPAANVPESLLNADVLALSAMDRNADGRVELYGVTTAGELVRWSRDNAPRWTERVLATVNLTSSPRSAELAVSDFNGDGMPDLLLVDGEGVAVLDVGDTGVSELFRYRASVVSALPLVADADRGPSLITVINTESGQQLVHLPPGPGRGLFTALTFEGQEEKADSMRSNRSGVGTRVAVRRGSSWTVKDTFDRHSGRGQSAQPLSVGMGTYDHIDYIAIDWSDGVFQTELDLRAGQTHRITETQRQLSSCPVLFAWNGDEWAFVSDVLGVGGIGFLHDPAAQGDARYGAPRPWEYFAIAESAMQPKDGVLGLKITEPMEELALLDTVQLVAYDLPPGLDMVLDERMGTGAPTVTGQAQYFRREHRPVRVTRDDGLDVTASVRSTDFMAADLGDAHPRFLGMLDSTRTLTLEFDQPLDTLDNPLLLKASGWVEYPYSQTVFAAWQSNALYTPPSLEAGDGRGNWVMLLNAFGYPAGMPREMSVPLGALPAGTTQLRLSSNLEIYWDALSVVEEVDVRESDIKRQFLALRGAELMQSGFPLRIAQPQKRPDYDFDRRVPFWDTRYPKGYYSKLGDVRPLLEQTDGAFVVIGPGEDVELSFEQPARLHDGWTRRYVLFVSGYAKDMDMYTQNSGTVGPLPVLPSANERLHEQFNTRYRDSY
ncbi:MAG: ASPIC/UnbV domain-containing protein [Pseudomonadota bacterium]